MDIVYSFFEAFGIKPKCQSQDKCGCKYCNNYDYTCKLNRIREECDYLNKFGWAFNYYPPITPEIMLNLQVILCNFHSEHECCLLITGNSIENITINILKDCIELKDYIQSEVLTLFSK